MAAEQDALLYTTQAFLEITDFLLGPKTSGVGVKVPGSAILTRRSANGPFLGSGGTLAAPVLGSTSTSVLALTNSDPTYGLVVGVNAADGHVWFQGQRMDGGTAPANISFCEAGGALLVGTPTRLAANTLHEFKTAASGVWPVAVNGNDRGALFRQSAPSGFYAWFENNGGTNTGSIAHSGSSTSYNTTSDERLKDDDGLIDHAEATAIMRLIEIHRFRWKINGQKDIGAFAQELHKVYPRAVTPGGWLREDGTLAGQEEHDANYMPWQVDYSALVPVMVAAWHNLDARLAALEARAG